METTIRRFPIGIQTFAEIISGKYLYIDKTGYINDIADKYKYVFLNRPLGFGKSLLSSTFHCYFEGRKELFEGLKAGEVKKEWTRHPARSAIRFRCLARDFGQFFANALSDWLSDYQVIRREDAALYTRISE